MRSNLSGFKKFVEDMDQSVEKKMDGDSGTPKHDTKMDYFGGLGDEMGMTWDDIVKAYTNSDGDDSAIYRGGKRVNEPPKGVPPQANAAFGLGSPKHEIMYKTNPWKIVPGSLTPNGADIMLIPDQAKGPKNRSYLKGGKMLNKGKPDTKVYHLNRKQLLDFLMGNWQQAVQSAGGAAGGDPNAAGGMPGAAPPGGGAAPPGGGMPGMPGMPGGM